MAAQSLNISIPETKRTMRELNVLENSVCPECGKALSETSTSGICYTCKDVAWIKPCYPQDVI